MVMSNTSAVAAIIHAVSAPSIFDAGALAVTISANAGVVSGSSASVARRNTFFMAVPQQFPASRRRKPGHDENLQRVAVGLAGADAQRVLDIDHENLSVADLPRLGRSRDSFNHAVRAIVRHHDLDLDLGQEIHGVFGAAVDFGMALLTTEA